MTPTQPPTSNLKSLALGLDLSQWQGPNFPFHQAGQAGYTFAYLRACVRTKHDPCYATNRARAIDAGLLTGAYHDLYPEPDSRCPSRCHRGQQADPG